MNSEKSRKMTNNVIFFALKCQLLEIRQMAL